MSAILCESFDYSSVAELQRRWTVNLPARTSLVCGRTGQAVNLNLLISESPFLALTLPNPSSLVLGFAFKVSGSFLGATTSYTPVCTLVDGANANLSLRMTNTYALILQNAAIVQQQYSGPTIIPDVWNFFEIKVTFGDSSQCIIKLNGVEVFNLLSDWKKGSNAYSNQIILGPTTVVQANSMYGVQFTYDDLYLLSAAGAALNDFLGDSKVIVCRPTGSGSYSELTPNGAAANFECVDEPAADDDSTYVSSSTAGQRDTYAVADLSAGFTPHFVQTVAVVRKDDAGARTIRHMARSGSVDLEGPDVAAAAAYLHSSQVFESDPAGGAWTRSGFNSAQFGFKVTA